MESDRTPLLRSSDEEQDSSINVTKNDNHDGENHTPVVAVQKSTGFIYLLSIFSAIGGFLFGYDTGVVSGAMILLKDHFNLNSLWQELVVSATVGAAALFAIVGGVTNDRLGRKPTILMASIVFTIGAGIMGLATNTGMLLAGRVTVGVGIGLASMTVPMYIAEAAPTDMRGRLVTLNNIFITSGQFIASLLDGAFSYDKERGWRYMLGLAGVPSIIMFIGFLFLPESPRWLVSKERIAQAKCVLKKIRGSTDVDAELQEIQTACQDDKILMESRGRTPIIIQMLTTPHVRKALIIGCGLQMFQQISGINTVMYYSASIIKMSGVKDASVAIWLAAGTASVNCIFTFVGLYLVEKIGRRSLTIGSLVGTTLSLIVLAVGFQLAASNSPAVTVTEHNLSTNMSDMCSNYSICNNCMQDSLCGFCYEDGSSNGHLNGSCVAIATDKIGEKNPSIASFGRCSSNNTESHDTVWAYDYCPTAYSWMAIFGLVLYLAFFAPGMGPMPWTINSEIYPLWARSTGNATSTFTNWIFNLFISMTFLTLTESLTRYGAFYLYSSFAFMGLIFVSAFLPETKGKTLEEVEDLFKKPWCSRTTSM